jgi:hypothetical protein
MSQNFWTNMPRRVQVYLHQLPPCPIKPESFSSDLLNLFCSSSPTRKERRPWITIREWWSEYYFMLCDNLIIYLISYNLLFNLMLQVICGRPYWKFHTGESVLPNIFLNRFRLLQRICLTRGATTEAILATTRALPNRR